jgi:hypothetical protein
MIRFGLTKVLGIGLRVLAFAPAVMRIGASLDAFYVPTAWLSPLSKFWYFPVFNGIFAVLCIMPYPDLLFRRRWKFAFLTLVVLVCGFMLRHEFLPFHYATPKVMNNPELRQDFEQSMDQPLGRGYKSSWTEGRETLWVVRKPELSASNILLFGAFYSVPLALFVLRAYEVERGISFRTPFGSRSTGDLPKAE